MSDDTTQKDVAAHDTAGGSDDTTKSSDHMIPKYRFDEVNNAKKTLEEQLSEYKGQAEKLRSEVKIAEARWKYWAEIVESDSVQSLMKEHPTLSVEQVIQLSWVTKEEAQSQSQNFEAILWGSRTPPEPPKEMTLEDEIAFLEAKRKSGELKL